MLRHVMRLIALVFAISTPGLCQSVSSVRNDSAIHGGPDTSLLPLAGTLCRETGVIYGGPKDSCLPSVIFPGNPFPSGIREFIDTATYGVWSISNFSSVTLSLLSYLGRTVLIVGKIHGTTYFLDTLRANDDFWADHPENVEKIALTFTAVGTLWMKPDETFVNVKKYYFKRIDTRVCETYATDLRPILVLERKTKIREVVDQLEKAMDRLNVSSTIPFPKFDPIQKRK